MMDNIIVDPIRAAIFAFAHLLGGSLGAGILSASALIRLGLLPLTLRLARRQQAQQRLLHALKPEVKALQEKHGSQPDLLFRETQALYQRAGYRPFDPVVVLGNLARVPIFSGMYGALRSIGGGNSFAWVLDLAKPNAPLAILVASMSGIAGYLGSQAGGAGTRSAAAMAVLGAALGIAFFMHVSSALVLSWGANAVVDVVQGAMLLRERRREAAALPAR